MAGLLAVYSTKWWLDSVSTATMFKAATGDPWSWIRCVACFPGEGYQVSPNWQISIPGDHLRLGRLRPWRSIYNRLLQMKVWPPDSTATQLTTGNCTFFVSFLMELYREATEALSRPTQPVSVRMLLRLFCLCCTATPSSGDSRRVTTYPSSKNRNCMRNHIHGKLAKCALRKWILNFFCPSGVVDLHEADMDNPQVNLNQPRPQENSGFFFLPVTSEYWIQLLQTFLFCFCFVFFRVCNPITQ